MINALRSRRTGKKEILSIRFFRCHRNDNAASEHRARADLAAFCPLGDKQRTARLETNVKLCTRATLDVDTPPLVIVRTSRLFFLFFKPNEFISVTFAHE